MAMAAKDSGTMDKYEESLKLSNKKLPAIAEKIKQEGLRINKKKERLSLT